MKNDKYSKYIVASILAIVGVIIWRLSSSYASVSQGYTGKNIISGDSWGINITKVSDVKKSGNADIIKDVSTIGTTLNFSVVLFKPGDKISFDIEVENTSVLDGELYALTLTGLNDIDSEDITYTILPLDKAVIHDDKNDGSIIKSGDKQKFNITVMYDEIATNNMERHLSLGSTIIYKQR